MAFLKTNKTCPYFAVFLTRLCNVSVFFDFADTFLVRVPFLAFCGQDVENTTQKHRFNASLLKIQLHQTNPICENLKGIGYEF